MAKSADTVTAIVRLANLLTREMAPLLQRHRLTPQQWLLVAALAESKEPPTMATLARALHLTKQNMTGMTGRLEELGLLHRVGDPADLRATRVHLTRRGELLYGKVQPDFERWSERRLGSLPVGDRKALRRVLPALLSPAARGAR